MSQSNGLQVAFTVVGHIHVSFSFFLLTLAKRGAILQILSNPQNNAMNINTKQRNMYIKVYISWDIKKCGIDLMSINPIPKGLIDL